MKTLSPFLMFANDNYGRAEEAMSFYAGLFADASLEIDRYAGGDGGEAGKVRLARLALKGVELRAIDAAGEHAFSFTPAMSLFVECESMDELERAYEQLLEGGSALMPIGDYGFSQRFAWVQDRYGVSWQLNLA